MVQNNFYNLHDQIIHRDIKPDNIMFVEQNNYETLTIVDFGLATETNVAKYMFPKCGTPGYVAPEVLNLTDRSVKYSEVCDIFSCGCIFYKLVTGSSLFSGKEFNEVLKINKLCEIDFTTGYFPEMPEDVLDLMGRMLLKDPKKRVTASEALQSSYFQGNVKICVNEEQQIPMTNGNFENFQENLAAQTNNIFCPKIKIPLRNSDIVDADEEGFSPFQRNAKNLPVQFQIKENLSQENLDMSSQRSDEEVMQEFNDKTHMQILNLPHFKKPGFKQIQYDSNKETSPTLINKNFRGSIIGSFYSKEPLDGTKRLQNKNQKDNSATKQQQFQSQVQQQETSMMKRISLFTKEEQQ